MFTNSERRDLLLLDWGIGGLSVYNEVKNRFPALGVVYVSDSGATPYGKMGAEELTGRLVALIGATATRFGLRDVIIACNAASTAREAVAERLPDLRITGMIEAGVAAARLGAYPRVGVIGGIRTVESGVYQRELGRAGVVVEARPAQPLSALIEKGYLRGPELDAALKPILEPLRGIPALLLACTHYPAIAGEIARFLPGTELLDPAPLVAEAARLAGLEAAEAPPEGLPEGESPIFFTTGDPAASGRSARLAFGVKADFAPVDWLRSG